MGFKSIALAATALILFTNVNAALLERLGGLAYYDDVSDLTWLADANAGYGTSYDSADGFTNGLMSWNNANAWATNLNISGVSGWRLPTTLQPDSSCSSQRSYGSAGSGCNGSELGQLFYNALGNSTVYTTGYVVNTGPFTNVQPYNYWSATELDTSGAWTFTMTDNGYQDVYNKTNSRSAWAVYTGDIGVISAVPVPAAVWLFGSGLIGIIGVARRYRS